MQGNYVERTVFRLGRWMRLVGQRIVYSFLNGGERLPSQAEPRVPRPPRGPAWLAELKSDLADPVKVSRGMWRAEQLAEDITAVVLVGALILGTIALIFGWL